MANGEKKNIPTMNLEPMEISGMKITPEFIEGITKVLQGVQDMGKTAQKGQFDPENVPENMDAVKSSARRGPVDMPEAPSMLDRIGSFFKENFTVDNIEDLISNPWALMGLAIAKSEFIDRPQREKEAEGFARQLAVTPYGPQPTIRVRPSTAGSDLLQAGMLGLQMNQRRERQEELKKRDEAVNKILQRFASKEDIDSEDLKAASELAKSSNNREVTGIMPPL